MDADLAQLLKSAEKAMDAREPPQVLLVIAARFARVAWKYRSIAYATTLKNVGALYQTFYMVAEAEGLAGCALGGSNIDLFASLTGLPFYEEGSVGEFALGRGIAN